MTALRARHVAGVGRLTPLETVPVRPAHRARRAHMSRWSVVALVVGIVAVLAISFGAGGLVQQRKARAYALPTFNVFNMTGYLNRLLDEIDQISVDEIRKLVAKEITKKVIEKVIYGGNGGTGIGGGGGTSNNGSGAFINDYYQYLYLTPQSQTSSYIDKAFDKYFPSSTDPQVKQYVKSLFDPNQQMAPSNCVDIRTIDFDHDKDAVTKVMYALQPGCNNMSATAMLYDLGRSKLIELSEAAKIEATSNKGLVSKDDKTNKLKQSGVVYEGIVQGALQAVYDVQTNSQSAVGSIIGALVDQVIDGILSQQSK